MQTDIVACVIYCETTGWSDNTEDPCLNLQCDFVMRMSTIHMPQVISLSTLARSVLPQSHGDCIIVGHAGNTTSWLSVTSLIPRPDCVPRSLHSIGKCLGIAWISHNRVRQYILPSVCNTQWRLLIRQTSRSSPLASLPLWLSIEYIKSERLCFG